MALTLLSTPDRYALTKGGRMLYQFSGSGRYQTTGVQAVNSLLFSPTHPVPDGTTIPLRWKGQTINLTAKTNPVNAGEFPAGDGSPAYVASILPYLKGYYPIRQDFTLRVIPGPPFSILELTAKQPGVDYTISPYSSNPAFSIGAAFPAGADPIVRDRYGVYIEVYVQKAGATGLEETDFSLVQSQHVEADADGLMQFDVGDLLHGYLSADIPSFGGSAGQLATNSHRPYFIAYAEAWGQPVRPGLIVSDDIRHAYLGGADFAHRGAGFSLDTFLKGTGSDEDRALRFGPATRRVYVDEPAWLSFINLRDQAAEVYAKVTLTFDDDSHHVSSSPQAVIGFDPASKVLFPVGITQLNLLEQVPAGRFLKEYSVGLFDTNGTAYSQAYRYIVDYDQRPYRRFFAYQNSLGAFDTLSTWGKGSAELQRFSDQAEQSLPAVYAPTAGQYVDYNVSRQQTIEVASGWQPQGELMRWDDFYCAVVRFQVTGTKAIAIGLTSKSIKQQKDGDTQFAHLFAYQYLHRDEYYTEDAPVGEEAVPPIAVPAGSVTLQPTVAVPTVDPSIPDVVRTLTTQEVDQFRIVAARPNPLTLGFLTQASGSTVFRRQDQPVSFATDLTDKPTSRDASGILDVPTQKETTQKIRNLVGFRPVLTSWIGDQEPS